MKVKVRALDTYAKMKIKDKELKMIPKKGFEFEVDEERYKLLSGDNQYREKFVELIEKVKTKKTKKIKDAADYHETIVAEDIPEEDGIIHHGEPIPVPVDPTIKDK